MDVNAGPETNQMYEIGPLTYRQGYVSVSMESYGCRADALMNDRAMVTVYTGTPEHQGNQVFRAWVDAAELPSVLGHWANTLS
ncbi:hypothetical protein [Streptomyces albipurpureus]|uniref:Uncharacterized protein n=1 Tax=Streptomyces albipurpureus TaxID=2897419 RepID=A0ABT0UN23_9ACTN|nr:hypothetical protein [Streptomyces sp. CWNU-1]MCM2389731.1 hypothetical protein [Streptomyces sp. CWNU-1]